MPRSNKSVSKKEYKCCKCGKTTEKIDNFSKVQSDLYDGLGGYLPICKKCLNQLYTKYCNLYHDHYKALKRICQLYDIYYSESIAATVEDYSPTAIATRYIGRINSLNQYDGKTYEDTIEDEEKAQELEKQNKINLSENVQVDEELEHDYDEITKDIIAEARRLFGNIVDDEDAIYLKSEFDEWKVRTGAKTKAEEEIIKNICYNQLSLIKARSNNENTDKIEEILLKNIKAGGWSPDNKDNSSLAEMNLGLWIQKIEQNRPFDEVDEKYKDIDGLKRMVNVFMVGHLGHSTGLKNVYVPEYEKEIDKYTVYKTNDDEELEETEMDLLFGNSGE